MIIDPAMLAQRLKSAVAMAEKERTDFGAYSQQVMQDHVALMRDVRQFIIGNDIIADARRYRTIREACGYVENGSSSSFSISQDDATKDWCARVGVRPFYGKSFGEVIDAVGEWIEETNEDSDND